MRRILLLLEDYNEQIFLETLLKKIGFDVLALRNEISLADQILIFKPDVIIATGDGNKIKGTNVNKKIIRNKSPIKLILLFPINKLQDQKLMAMYSADVAVETPVNPKVLISTICAVTQLDSDAILKKFEKLPIAKGDSAKSDGVKIISGKIEGKHNNGAALPTDRKERYAQILKNSPEYEDRVFPKDRVAEEVEEMRKWEKESKECKDIDKERQKFVVSLFKK